jgi:hypothetical protein
MFQNFYINWISYQYFNRVMRLEQAVGYYAKANPALHGPVLSAPLASMLSKKPAGAV